MFWFVQLLYQSRQVWDELTPDYICWNRSISDKYKNSTGNTVEDFHCVPATKLYLNLLTYDVNTHLPKIAQLVLAIQVLFSHCDPPKVDPTLYQCAFGLSISPHRVLDIRYNDCSPWLIWQEEEHAETVDNIWVAPNLPDRFRCSHNQFIPRVFIHDNYWDCFSGSDEILFVGCHDEFDCQHLRELDLSQEPLISYQEICDGS